MNQISSNIIEVFPQAVGVYRMPKNGIDDVKEKSFEIIRKYEGDTEVYKTNGNSIDLEHYFNSAGQDLLEEPGWEKFHEWIKDCTLHYITDTLGYKCDNVVITDCWLNKCDYAGFQFMHCHSNSFISGTYYVNFETGKHPHLGFQFPGGVPGAMHKPYLELTESKQTKYNSTGAILPNAEGDLLLWQSNLLHGYENSHGDNRVSISFNVLPEVLDCRGTYSFKVVKK
jgi:uncharacterized protein (TIGR02466 family)